MRVGSMLLIVQALSQPALASDDFETVRSKCESVSEARKRVERCLALIANKRISEIYYPLAYSAVAYAFFQLDDFAQSIAYTRTEIEISSSHLKDKLASKTLPATAFDIAAMSARYVRLGQYQGLARLQIDRDRSEERFKYARAEFDSFSAALNLNRENHEAFVRRAEVNSLLCRDAEARSDMQMAQRLAERKQDEKAMREYRFFTLPACETAWRGRS